MVTTCKPQHVGPTIIDDVTVTTFFVRLHTNSLNPEKDKFI